MLETDVIYRFMDEFRSSYVAWLGCFFIVTSFWTIDNMLQALRLALSYIYAPANKNPNEFLMEQE